MVFYLAAIQNRLLVIPSTDENNTSYDDDSAQDENIPSDVHSSDDSITNTASNGQPPESRVLVIKLPSGSNPNVKLPSEYKIDPTNELQIGDIIHINTTYPSDQAN